MIMKEDLEIRCPFCGDTLSWGSDANCADIDESYENEIVRYYECKNCGARIEAWECPNSEKKYYPFWKKENK